MKKLIAIVLAASLASPALADTDYDFVAAYGTVLVAEAMCEKHQSLSPVSTYVPD